MPQYTTLTPEELNDIVAHYEVGTPIDLEELLGGFGNSNYKLTTTEDKFLLKICDEKNLEELHQQITLLEHLKKHAYPTVYPILQKNGDALHVFVKNVNEKKHVMIYPFLDGETPKPSKHVLAQIGEALAKLHRIPPIANLPRFPLGITKIIPFLKEIRQTELAPHPFFLWLQSELEWIIPEIEKPLPTGLLHGDLFLDNTLFDDEKMVAILDFEEGCHDTLLIDVAMTIIGCCYTEENDLNIDALHDFLNAYDALRPLTKNEWECLDGFVYYAALSIAVWRFRQFNIRHPDVHRAETYLEMISRSANWQTIKP